MTVKMSEKERIKKLEQLLWFCAKCFATNENGSWSGGVDVSKDGKRTHCTNCGAGNCAVRIPRWAVDSIREQASWVGKRYYPADEDRENHRELEDLRATIKEFPGRTAEKSLSDHPDDVNSWFVRQELPGGGNVGTHFTAKSAEEALEKARLHLPYIPENRLKRGK